MGSNGKLTFILRVFISRAALEERTEFKNWDTTAFESTGTCKFSIVSLLCALYVPYRPACIDLIMLTPKYTMYTMQPAPWSPAVVILRFLLLRRLNDYSFGDYGLCCGTPWCAGWGAHGVDCRMLLGRFIPIPLVSVYIAWADYQPHPTPRRLRQDVASKTLGKVLATYPNPFHLTLLPQPFPCRKLLIWNSSKGHYLHKMSSMW
jgi:hypothetical protein